MTKAFVLFLALSSLDFADDLPKVVPPQPLSLEDRDTLSQAVIQVLNTRVIQLESLNEGRGDISHQKNYDGAVKAYGEEVAALRKKYNAPGCTPDVMTKEWKCSPLAVAKEK